MLPKQSMCAQPGQRRHVGWGMIVGKLTQLTLECDDAEQLARFWQEAPRPARA